MCAKLEEPYRAYDFWDERYKKAQTVGFWNVRRETGYSMAFIIEQRATFLRRILDVDLSGDF